jgi:hypothetical protein
MAGAEHRTRLLEGATCGHGHDERRDHNSQDDAQLKAVPINDDYSALHVSKTLPTFPSTHVQEGVLRPIKEDINERTTSVHLAQSQSSTASIDNCGVGRPCRKRVVNYVDIVAVSVSVVCFIIGVLVVVPTLTLSWRVGLQSQLVTIGFILGVMNICANKVVPPFLLAIEARYGSSRLQNFDAILTNKLLSSHTQAHWRVVLVIFMALPLALSIGYKQFFGGTSSATLKPLSGLYGISFPIISEWTPINDHSYLLTSATAAFHTASANDTSTLEGSGQFPMAYGYNVLLLAEGSAALLDLPTNEYLGSIRSKLKNGETWKLSASVDAYVATLDELAAEAVRTNDTAWEVALNASQHGLASYFLNQDVKTWVGMLPNVSQPACWIGMFEGGPVEDDTYSQSLDDFNTYGFQQSAKLFDLSRQRCHASWNVSASGLRLIEGFCDGRSQLATSQEPVSNPARGVWAVEGSSSLNNIFVSFVKTRPNSTWLMPTYAVTTATYYWARGVYVIPSNNIAGFTYTSIDEQIVSTRKTLDAVPMLFICLAIQPVLTILAFVVKSTTSLPISGNFGLIAVLAGVKSFTLDTLTGAGYSGELTRPLKLEISLTVQENIELEERPAAAVRYELKAERLEKYKVPKADTKTVYF